MEVKNCAKFDIVIDCGNLVCGGCMQERKKMMEKAIQYLEKNRLLHIGMLEAIRKGNAEILEASEEGVLLLDRSCNVHMMSAANQEKGKALLDQITDCYQLIVCQEELVPYASEKFGMYTLFPCKKVVRFSKEKLDLKTDLRIERADEAHVTMIKEVYHTIPPEEVDEISRRGNLFCAFAGEEFVGFSGNHLDGSLGLLDIFPAYQGRGYGETLERFMVNYILDKGDIPYGEIVIGNTISENLQRKLGFEISEETITWLL